MWGRVLGQIKDCLFPYFCLGCGKEGEWWCGECRSKNKIEPFEFEAGDYLEKVTALFNYEEKHSLAKLIKTFKYGWVRDIKSLWREIIFDSDLTTSKAVLIAVPLHPRRERERGFNQAEELAGILSEKYQLKTDFDHLIRKIYTSQQSSLTREKRLKNVEEAFLWVGDTAPEKVVLIDDVFTTGATMQECAKALKRAGVKQVSGFVLARG